MCPELELAMCHRVYPITKRIAIGQFATPDRAYYLLENGYTHVLNVSEAASVLRASEDGFRRVTDHRLDDLVRIPDESARSCLDVLDEMLQVDGSSVYLHCIACRDRSPTILWLYLLTCGLENNAAKSLITERCPDAVPGHGDLVDDRLVKMVREHGQRQILPLHDPAIIEPAY